MDFTFTEEQNAIRETARRFATDRLAPVYQQGEKDGCLNRDIIREMGDLGLITPLLPEEFGGLGVDYVTMGIVVEELSKGDFSYGNLPILGAINGGVICNHGSREMAEEWGPKICNGEAIVALGLTEPRGGSDAANLALQATKKGDKYILKGEKTSITAAPQADAVLVAARTGSAEDKAHGVTAFLVPMDTPGVSWSKFDDVGYVAVGRGSIFFDNVEVPEEWRIGDEGKGFIQVMSSFDYSRALLALECVAAAQASVDATWEYIAEREVFGSPLVKFEGASFPLAEAETLLEACRLLCYKTLWLRDQGLPHTAEAAMCKWWGPKTAFDVLHNCVLLHGHGGYSKDYPHQQRMRDVMGLEIGDGTAQIQKIIIAREKIGRIAVPY